MADLLIKGMEMPKNCKECELMMDCDSCEGWEVVCVLQGCLGYLRDLPKDKRLEDCPLVEVPTHGRLIDADVLMREYEKAQKTMEAHGQEYSCSFLSAGLEISTEWYCVEDMLDSAPTVIEASEVE